MARWTMTMNEAFDPTTKLMPDEIPKDDYIIKTLMLDRYPIYSEDRRLELNTVILSTYWNQEIAFDTWGEFIQQLYGRMVGLMKRYSPLMESVEIAMTQGVLDARIVQLTENDEAEAETSQTGESENFGLSQSDGSNEHASPPGRAAGFLDRSIVDTQVRNENESNSRDNGTYKGDSISRSTMKRVRDTIINNRTNAELITAWQEAAQAYDMEIVDAIRDLFMLI